MAKKWDKESCIKAIQEFYLENKRIPKKRDFIGNKKYPSYGTVQNHCVSWNNAVELAGFDSNKNASVTVWNKLLIKNYLQSFYSEHNRPPKLRELTSPSWDTIVRNFGSYNKALEYSEIPLISDGNQQWDYTTALSYLVCFLKAYNNVSSKFYQKYSEGPSVSTIVRYFGTWTNAVEAAGFEPNTQNGFGMTTYGLDGHLYRSQAEAYFADNFLYNIYTYEIEPKYPNNTWMYDWYIKELDLYIELAGGLRPERIAEKIKLNKQLNRRCLVIPLQDLYTKDFERLWENIVTT